MLSSVSYVCLGVCAGMWVISRDIYLDVLVLSFISVLLFQRSGHFCLFLPFCVCVFFSFFFAFILPIFSALLCGHMCPFTLNIEDTCSIGSF